MTYGSPRQRRTGNRWRKLLNTNQIIMNTETKPEAVEVIEVVAPKNVQELLSKIQREINVPKGQLNKFGGYKYRSCEDILEAVKPLLVEGATILLNDEIVLIGSRYYVRATAGITFNGDTLFVCALARESESKKGMDESQITGATSSYARKYALNGLLLIDDAKDADTQDNTKEETKTPAKAVKSIKEQVLTAIDQAKTGAEVSNLLAKANASTKLTSEEKEVISFEANQKLVTLM